MTRTDTLKARAASCGLLLCTYSPGDGVTRYAPEGQCYFGPDNGIYTALGYKEADTWLSGCAFGRDAGIKVAMRFEEGN